ncbi:MAG: HD domain-containing protein [Acidaminococcaceae bacterium]|jgi:putative nucleotidyltransferase with HDIG domain|nr:HD domain-containing protein [Acidaminococcaceae bacterium]
MISIPQYLEFPSTGKTKEICEFFLEMLERKNKSLYMHSQQVANYAACIAAQLGLSPREIKTIKTGALLHDIGHLSVPNVVLNKAPYLSVREAAQFKKHCIAGYSMLENMEEFSDIIDLIRSHHEHWNGTGYPDRLKGVNIPLGARIIAVADHYDQNINPCTQKWQKTHEEAVLELQNGAGTLFDPAVVKAFMDAVAPEMKALPVKEKAVKKAAKKKPAKKHKAAPQPKAAAEPVTAAVKKAAAPEKPAAVEKIAAEKPAAEKISVV